MTRRTDEILSREELEALLASVDEVQREQEPGLPGARAPGEETARNAPRDFREFCGELGKEWTTRFQTLVRVRLTRAEVTELAALSHLTLPEDSVVLLSAGGEIRGALAANRSLFFGWLARCFGARAGAPAAPLRGRPFTHIERHFLQRLGEQLLLQLQKTAPQRVPAELVASGTEAAAVLADRSDTRALLLDFEVTGFGDAGRLRVALPWSSEGEGARVTEPSLRGALDAHVLSAPVELRAELGSAELTLARLAALRVGETLPIQTRPDGALAVKIGGELKFTGARGRVGPRRAVQIVERLAAGEAM